MKNLGSCSRVLPWFMALLLSMFVVACGGGGQSPILGTGGVAPLTSKALTSFSLAGVPGTINEAGKSIAVTLPNGSNVTALVASFATTGSSVKVGATTQVSGVTPNNFTAPVVYTVTAANGSTANYSVTVSVAPVTAKALTSYSLAGVPGVINETAKTVALTLPAGTNVTALVASFSSTGASVNVGATTQVSGTTANNFTGPVAYTVTAADSTTAVYTVTVLVAPATSKAITSYSLGGINGTINEAAKTIAVPLPAGTSVTALVATFSSTGASVKVGATTQTSGATANNFTAPVIYTVTAADASTANYTVSANVAAAGPAPVSLGAAGNFVMLAKSAISTVPNSAITGDVGVSPAATTFLTGFSLTLVGTTSATSTQVTGTLYGADMTTPTNSNLTTAVSAMETAYTDAATRPAPADFLNLGSGEIGGRTLVPGLYNWTTGVTISTDVTVSGGPNDVWIFQIPGNLTMASARNVILAGGAQAKNIFWQVAGFAQIGTTAHFEGILLSQTEIRLLTGASMNGRALAQTQITLDQATVTQPAP